MLALDDNMRDRMLGFVGLILLALAAIALYFGVMALYEKRTPPDGSRRGGL